MSDSLLTVVQDFCAENSLPIPAGVCGVTETGVAQYKALMKRLVTELSQYVWKEQVIRKTFTTIASEDQGSIATVIGADCRGIIQNSIWNESQRRPLVGPVPPAVWESLKALPVTGPLDRYSLHGDHFHILPAPIAGETIGLMYQSSYGIIDETRTTTKANFTDDSDQFLFPDIVLGTGLDYLWKKAKGEDWQGSYGEFMGQVAKNIVKDTAPILQLDQAQQNIRPGIWVPSGSWGV
jgi:hypothetical protein